jgi:hypothetical protein
MEINYNSLIGKGGFGEVYDIVGRPDLVVKVSKNVERCNSSKIEFDKAIAIISAIKDTDVYRSLEHVVFLAPLSFEHVTSTCYMISPKVFRPVFGRCETAGMNESGPTIQAQLGVESDNSTFPGRGQFVGLSEILSYLDACPAHENPRIDTICFELGILLGLIHFVALNDAFDIEVFFGRLFQSSRLKFFIADFDQTQTIQMPPTVEQLERMIVSIDAIPYFPSPTVSPALFKEFVKGYTGVAAQVGVEDLANLILEKAFSQSAPAPVAPTPTFSFPGFG